MVVWATIARKHRKAFLSSRLVKVKGVLESHQGVVHVIAQRLKIKPIYCRLNATTNDGFIKRNQETG